MGKNSIDQGRTWRRDKGRIPYSPYQDPVWGRFLNADGIIGTSERRTGWTLYSR